MLAHHLVRLGARPGDERMPERLDAWLGGLPHPRGVDRRSTNFGAADRLKPLNAPQRIKVQINKAGHPTGAARMATAELTAVEAVLDRWRIDDEWWRKAVSRMYYQLALAGGTTVTIFQDLVTSEWFVQTTATPIPRR